MSLSNVAARALLANQAALHTTGHNIANVHTAGYSRQSAVLKTTPGQDGGAGRIGNGVDVQTIARQYSALLARQAASSAALGASASARAQALEHFARKKAFAHWHPQVLQDYVQGALVDCPDAASGQTRRALHFTREVETAIYNSVPHNLQAILRRHPLRCPAAFIGARGSR